MTGLLPTRNPEQPGRQQQPAGEEDGEQGQALHQPADIGQRPSVGEDQRDGGQHDDDTEDTSGEVLPARGYQRGSRASRCDNTMNATAAAGRNSIPATT
jgi:hypothetical protein